MMALLVCYFLILFMDDRADLKFLNLNVFAILLFFRVQSVIDFRFFYTSVFVSMLSIPSYGLYFCDESFILNQGF
ncbi:hypothetical protein COU62_04570 [Candidatus Pacearchaeota archaeon CG10_big_fil_rev_8_21_14_0_10_35_219]|nr:MAG: hypothetical protein COU62_04570 [Candidatus Pacearchaeota archaeon CG10_big_fil_rev_8_21_14_0_10_35_219]